MVKEGSGRPAGWPVIVGILLLAPMAESLAAEPEIPAHTLLLLQKARRAGQGGDQGMAHSLSLKAQVPIPGKPMIPVAKAAPGLVVSAPPGPQAIPLASMTRAQLEQRLMEKPGDLEARRFLLKMAEASQDQAEIARHRSILGSLSSEAKSKPAAVWKYLVILALVGLIFWQGIQLWRESDSLRGDLARRLGLDKLLRRPGP